MNRRTETLGAADGRHEWVRRKVMQIFRVILVLDFILYGMRIGVDMYCTGVLPFSFYIANS